MAPPQDGQGWTRDMVSWVPSLYMLFLCLSGPLVGWLADKYGPRVVVIPGAALIGLGLVLASRVTVPWHLYIFYSLFMGVGASAVGNAIMPTVVRWFPHRMSLVAATVACGAFVGTMAMAPLVTRAISAWGWRTTSVILGCFSLAVIALALLIKRPPVQAAAPAGKNAPIPGGLTLGQALRTRSLWALFALFVLAYIGAMMVQYQLTPHATDMGQSKELAANLLVVISAIGLAGKLGGGAAADKLGRRRMFLAFAMLLQGVTLAMLPRATTGASLYAFAAVWGLGYGMWAPQLVTVVGETFGLRNVASIMGLVGMSFGVGGTIGPALAGKIFSTSGSYSLAFYLGAGAMLLAAAIMVLLVKPARAPEPTAGTTATATALPERA